MSFRQHKILLKDWNVVKMHLLDPTAIKSLTDWLFS